MGGVQGAPYFGVAGGFWSGRHSLNQTGPGGREELGEANQENQVLDLDHWIMGTLGVAQGAEGDTRGTRSSVGGWWVGGTGNSRLSASQVPLWGQVFSGGCAGSRISGGPLLGETAGVGGGQGIVLELATGAGSSGSDAPKLSGGRWWGQTR